MKRLEDVAEEPGLEVARDDASRTAASASYSTQFNSRGEKKEKGRSGRGKMPRAAEQKLLLSSRRFKEDLPSFQASVRLKRLEEARSEVNRERPGTDEQDTGLPRLGFWESCRSPLAMPQGQDFPSKSELKEGEKQESVPSAEQAKETVISGPTNGDGNAEKDGCFSREKPPDSRAPVRRGDATSKKRSKGKVFELAADLGSEEDDIGLGKQLAAERKRRGKHQKDWNESLLRSDGGPALAHDTSKGFATALDTILSRQLTKSRSTGANPILSEAPEVYEQLSQKKKAERADRQKRAERKALRDRPHRPVDILDAEYERSLKKIAIKGVVKLFNAIIQVKRKRARRGFESDEDENLSHRAERVKKRREYQKTRQRINAVRAKRSGPKSLNFEKTSKASGKGLRQNSKSKK